MGMFPRRLPPLGACRLALHPSFLTFVFCVLVVLVVQALIAVGLAAPWSMFFGAMLLGFRAEVVERLARRRPPRQLDP